MPIDYDSGAGFFDKAGPVVRVANLLEEFEIGTGAGTLEKELTDIETELEVTKEGDAEALSLLLQKWEGYRRDLWGMKTRISELIRPLLASEIVDAENFESETLEDMLTRLTEVMIRDGRKVTSNGVLGSYVPFTPGVPAPVGTVQVMMSAFDLNDNDVLLGDSVSQVRGDAIDSEINGFRCVCVDQTIGEETLELRAEYHPDNSNAGNPSYEKKGVLGTFPVLSSNSSKTLVRNGGFELQTSAGTPSNWNTFSQWGTTITLSPDSLTGSKSVKITGESAGPLLQQSLDPSKFSKGRKYFLNLFYKFDNAATEMSLDVCVYINESLVFKREIPSWPSGTAPVVWTSTGLGFNCLVPRIDSVVISIENCAVTVPGEIYVDEIILAELTDLNGYYPIAFMTGNIPPVLDDYWYGTMSNDHAGIFQTYFARYHNILLPSYGAGAVIADALAS